MGSADAWTSADLPPRRPLEPNRRPAAVLVRVVLLIPERRRRQPPRDPFVEVWRVHEPVRREPRRDVGVELRVDVVVRASALFPARDLGGEVDRALWREQLPVILTQAVLDVAPEFACL